jgi:hypothetical protein
MVLATFCVCNATWVHHPWRHVYNILHKNVFARQSLHHKSALKFFFFLILNKKRENCSHIFCCYWFTPFINVWPCNQSFHTGLIIAITMSLSKCYEKYSIDKIDVYRCRRDDKVVKWIVVRVIVCPTNKEVRRRNQWRNPGCWSFPRYNRWFTKKSLILLLMRV